jgi:type VI protein secretion system component VasK
MNVSVTSVMEVVGFLLLILAGLSVLLLWLWMLVQAVTLPNSTDKIVWVLILLIAGIFGMVAYSVVRPHRRARSDGLTDEDERLIAQMRRERENRSVPGTRVQLTPEEERMVAEMRRAYAGEGR